jgi:MoxR-like ATPase
MSQPLKARFDAVRRDLEQKFLAKEEIIRLMLIAAIAGEHMVLIGPPGTAKSAVIRSFARLLDARYFEYLLTRFSEPNELFGPVDIQGFRSGTYRRVTTGMLPEAEIVFLDEAFKANSAILNSLLTVLNERRFNNGATSVRVPLISLFAASNEVPSSDNLDAIYDRFLLRVHSDNLDSYHFHELMTKGLALERAAARADLLEAGVARPAAAPTVSSASSPEPGPHPVVLHGALPPLGVSSSPFPSSPAAKGSAWPAAVVLQGGAPQALSPSTTTLLSAADLHECRRALLERVELPEEFLATYKGLCFQLRGEGISLSDRRAVRLLKLFAASAFLDGRTRVHEGDLFLLRHTWNNLDQREILDDVVEPVVSQYYANHPDDRVQQAVTDLDRLVNELNLVHRTLTQSGELSDIQLFTQLRNLNDLRSAFAQTGGDTAQRMMKQIDALLEQIFDGGRLGQERRP